MVQSTARLYFASGLILHRILIREFFLQITRSIDICAVAHFTDFLTQHLLVYVLTSFAECCRATDIDRVFSVHGHLTESGNDSSNVLCTF